MITAAIAAAVTRTRDARGVPCDPARMIAELLLSDPGDIDHLAVMTTVIVCDALADPFHETTAHRWRVLRPVWLHPQMVGVAVRRLCETGLLVSTGRYLRHGPSRGNRGQRQAIYALDLTVLTHYNEHAR